jgi:hypothetical protein
MDATGTTDRSERYLDEVLLEPDQVNDVALSAAEPNSEDADQHAHADY